MDDKSYLHTRKGGEQSNVHGGSADAPPEGHLCRFFSAHGKKLGCEEQSSFPHSSSHQAWDLSPATLSRFTENKEVVAGERGSGLL